MKRLAWLIIALVLGLTALTRCNPSKQVAPSAFDTLARWVPADADFPFFLDLKPDGETGRHWERIRGQMEANPMGQEVLKSLFKEFRVAEYGLDEFITGPAVSGYWREGNYVIAQVSDDEAARDALRQHFEDVTWEQEEYEGRTLNQARISQSSGSEWLAWSIHDGLLFLSSSYHYDRKALPQLQALVSLTQADSLAALPAWQTLRARLPETPMGLLFANIAEQARNSPPSSNDTSLGSVLNQQLVALAFAAVPENEGMRVEIAGAVALQPDASPRVRAVFDLVSSVNPATWTHLPADTAITLMAHDLSVLWPWLDESFNLDGLTQLGDTVGLDFEADLASEEGPLTGDFALAITPPLPQQPISQGLPAGQLLILAHGASEAQVAKAQVAMEARGAVFGPREAGGVPLQTQAGTRPSGYAISYGFDGDTFLFGSSPDVISQGVAAHREDKGLVATPTFQAMLAALPDDPSLLFYINTRALTGIAQTNMSEEQYQKSPEYILLEAFEAIGLGLQLRSDRLDGVIYFIVE